MSNPNFPTLTTAEVAVMREALHVAATVYLEDGLTSQALAVMDLVGEIFHGEDPSSGGPEPRKRLGQHVGSV